MSKKFTPEFPDLEKTEVCMKAGDVTFRQTLHKIAPKEHGESRPAWFIRAGRKVQITASRLKSLFYNPDCTVSFEEGMRIVAELRKVERMQEQIDFDARTFDRRLRDLQEQQENILNELRRLESGGSRPH